MSGALRGPVNGTTAIPWRSRRSRQLSLLEQLRGCQEAWCPAAPWDREGAHAAICGTPAGSFLVVRDSATSRPGLLCVSAGGRNGAVHDHSIESTGTVLRLSGSRLSFSDLAQLVLFYSLTRDVISVCLSVPRWLRGVTENPDPGLHPDTWLHTPTDQPAEEMTWREPGEVMCSLQLTSSSGALCVINPLYLHEHGDEWLPRRAAPPANYSRGRRLSTPRPWAGAGLQSKRTSSLDQEASGAGSESSGLTRATSADSANYPPTPSPPGGVVLRRPSRDSDCGPLYGPPSPPSAPVGLNSAFELQSHGGPPPQSPHRVSWIEDGVWLPPPRPPPSLHPPSLELDSLSISSVEEEQDAQAASPAPPLHPCALRLADKVIHRLSAVGQALGGLVSQRKRLTNRVQELSERKGAAFADAVRGFVEAALRKGADPGGVAPGSEFLQEVRSALSALKETLLDYQEIQALLDSIADINDLEIDSLVELSLHKVALKPVAEHLYARIRASRTDDGSFERLQRNMRSLEKNGVEELGGSAGVGVPDAVVLERIQQRWSGMHEAYSPNKKVRVLLKVCKIIYHSMSANASSGTAFGADDFLPCLTWVLLRSDVVTLHLDTDYMMELLGPTQLQGEGGYYLTTLYASLYYISSFQPRLAARQLSIEAQHSLNQWHRRRTLHCDQSRRSGNRRTIRRQVFRDKGSPDAGTVAKGEGESGKEDQSVKGEESELREEEETGRGRGPEWESQMSSPASDRGQRDAKTSERDEGRTLCTEGEEHHR